MLSVPVFCDVQSDLKCPHKAGESWLCSFHFFLPSSHRPQRDSWTGRRMSWSQYACHRYWYFAHWGVGSRQDWRARRGMGDAKLMTVLTFTESPSMENKSRQTDNMVRHNTNMREKGERQRRFTVLVSGTTTFSQRCVTNSSSSLFL